MSDLSDLLYNKCLLMYVYVNTSTEKMYDVEYYVKVCINIEKRALIFHRVTICVNMYLNPSLSVSQCENRYYSVCGHRNYRPFHAIVQTGQEIPCPLVSHTRFRGLNSGQYSS